MMVPLVCDADQDLNDSLRRQSAPFGSGVMVSLDTTLSDAHHILQAPSLSLKARQIMRVFRIWLALSNAHASGGPEGLWQRFSWFFKFLAVAVVLSLVAFKVWSVKQSREKSHGNGAPMSLLGAVAHAKAAPMASPVTMQDFQKECLGFVQQRLYRQATIACDKFTVQADLAPRAHSTLAALYTTRAILDIPSSVRHAAMAAKSGDARGKFLLSAHMLSGQYRPFDERLLRQLLKESKEGGVRAAGLYLQALEDSQTCRVTTKIMPLGLPIFCMFRAELQQALRQKGFRVKDEDLRQWQDSFSPSDVLANARDAIVQFDASPSEEIHRVARLSYLIIDEQSEQRWGDLTESLSRKYGKPKVVSPDKELAWSMGDGTWVRMVREDTWQLRVSYEHADRLKGRVEHLLAAEQTARQDRVLAEAEAL